RPDRKEIAFARKIAVASLPLWKGKGIVEQEFLVAEHVEQKRQVVRRDEPHRFGPRGVEQAIRRVERRREQRARTPFETVGLAFAAANGGAPVSGEDVEHLVIKMVRPI